MLWFYAKTVLKTLELPKLLIKSNLKGPGGELEAKYYLRRKLWPKYLGQTVVFLWNSTLREQFNFIFEEFFGIIDKILILGERLSTRLQFIKFFDLFDTFWFPKFVTLKSLRNWWDNSYILCLLLIITKRFTCCDTEILSNIKMSQNIMARIVSKIFFWLLCLN